MAACMKEALPDAGNPGVSDTDPETIEPMEFVVTIKKDVSGKVYFQKGNSERLFPRNGYEFTEECRALGSFLIYPVEEPGYGRICDIEWLEEIDKGLVVSNSSVGFEDGIDVNLQSRKTSIEDGYLTVHYNAWWGKNAGHHDIGLVNIGHGEFNLVHEAHSDAKDIYAEGLVYFDINSLLPATDDVPLTITVNWLTTTGGITSSKFGFISRK